MNNTNEKWRKRDTLKTIEECHLRNLGVDSVQDINGWYTREYRLDGTDRLAEILAGFKNHGSIHIMGDYDVDGVTSVAIMVRMLKMAGFNNVKWRVPHRFSEGFGMKTSMLDEIKEPAETLIITVDNGITATDVVREAKRRGCTVVITDHHLPDRDENGNIVYPEADLIIDPNAIDGSADFNGYCGAGISYRIAETVLGKTAALPLLPFAAIGTIADVMELREENHKIVRRGLSILTAGRGSAGIRQLMERFGMMTVSSDDVAFRIGPALNAPGRLYDDGAAKSVRLLITDDTAEASELAEDIIRDNEIRKNMVREAVSKVGSEDLADIPAILYIPGISEGIVGIIAGKIAEDKKIPVMVFSDSETPGILKGSGRAPEGFHLKNFCDMISSEFEAYGGHAGAVGASISDLQSLRDAARNAIKEFDYTINGNESCREYDLETDEADAVSIIDEEAKFGPFGEGNEKLTFKISNCRVMPRYGKTVHHVGADGIKLFTDNLTLIGFGIADRFDGIEPMTVTVYGHLSYNEFRGTRTPQAEIIDIEIEEEAGKVNSTPFSELLFEMSKRKAAGK